MSQSLRCRMAGLMCREVLAARFSCSEGPARAGGSTGKVGVTGWEPGGRAEGPSAPKWMQNGQGSWKPCRHRAGCRAGSPPSGAGGGAAHGARVQSCPGFCPLLGSRSLCQPEEPFGLKPSVHVMHRDTEVQVGAVMATCGRARLCTGGLRPSRASLRTRLQGAQVLISLKIGREQK